MNRRALLSTASAFALVACTPGSTTPAQIVADAVAAFTGLKNGFPAISGLLGKSADGILADIMAGLGLANSISNNLPPATTGATVLAQSEGYLNTVLSALAGFPLIPPPYSLIIMAAAVVAPEIETFINSIVGTTTARAALRARAMAPTMTIAQARVILAGAK